MATNARVGWRLEGDRRSRRRSGFRSQPESLTDTRRSDRGVIHQIVFAPTVLCRIPRKRELAGFREPLGRLRPHVGARRKLPHGLAMCMRSRPSPGRRQLDPGSEGLPILDGCGFQPPARSQPGFLAHAPRWLKGHPLVQEAIEGGTPFGRVAGCTSLLRSSFPAAAAVPRNVRCTWSPSSMTCNRHTSWFSFRHASGTV